jgi:hypothetical protein
MPHNASFGFLDRPPATLGVFASLDRFELSSSWRAAFIAMHMALQRIEVVWFL